MVDRMDGVSEDVTDFLHVTNAFKVAKKAQEAKTIVKDTMVEPDTSAKKVAPKKVATTAKKPPLPVKQHAVRGPNGRFIKA
jgi:formiminotetrahydrofolate cyclodeaminase